MPFAGSWTIESALYSLQHGIFGSDRTKSAESYLLDMVSDGNVPYGEQRQIAEGLLRVALNLKAELAAANNEDGGWRNTATDYEIVDGDVLVKTDQDQGICIPSQKMEEIAADWLAPRR